MKIYFVKHQAHGVVWEYPFAESPTEAQQERVWQFCFGIHGASHQKTPGEPYWQHIVSSEVLGPDGVPAYEPPGLKMATSVSQAGEVTVTGRATVTPRETGTPKKGS